MTRSARPGGGARGSVDSTWATAWLDQVADGTLTMSQRNLRTIAKRAGGIAALRALAKERNVHLILLEDDKGNELVAASPRPFKVIC